MSKSLKGLKNYLVAKGGYSITPKCSQLNDLKNLLNNMYQIRSNNTCNYHSGTSYKGELSIGDMYKAGQQLKMCVCNSDKDSTCDCEDRSGCYCNEVGDHCSCNFDNPQCDCEDRSYKSTCRCDIDKYNCRCENRGNPCDCNKDGQYCSCHDRYGSCNSDNCAFCDCENRTYQPTCDCNDRYWCSCKDRSGSCGSVISTCDCDGRCACNVEKRFN